MTDIEYEHINIQEYCNIFDSFDHDHFYGTPDSMLLRKIINAGFKPIGITVMLCEETFIFRTKEEAEKAGDIFLPEGWWYGLSDWEETYREYVDEIYAGNDDFAPDVHWLDKNFETKRQ